MNRAGLSLDEEEKRVVKERHSPVNLLIRNCASSGLVLVRRGKTRLEMGYTSYKDPTVLHEYILYVTIFAKDLMTLSSFQLDLI